MKIVIENVSDGENIPHNILLIRGRVDNLDSSLLEGKMIKISMYLKVYNIYFYIMCLVPPHVELNLGPAVNPRDLEEVKI